MAPAPDLNDLIATVDRRRRRRPTPWPAWPPRRRSRPSSPRPATRSSATSSTQCRAAGHTWAEISESLGVSRQAAHKRYSAIPRDLERWTPSGPSRCSSTRVEHRASPSGTPTSAPSTCCSGSSRPGASAPRSSTSYGLTEETVADQVLAHAPPQRHRPRRPAVHPARRPGARRRAQRGDLDGPQLHRHRAPAARRCSVSPRGWRRRSSPTPAPPTPTCKAQGRRRSSSGFMTK